MTRKTSKTPLEIAQELQARADAAKIRAAAAESADHPVVAGINSEIANTTKLLNKARTEADSASSRLAALEARGEWIKASAKLAKAKAEELESHRETLKNLKMRAIADLANGDPVIQEIPGLHFSTYVADLSEIATQREKEWRNFEAPSPKSNTLEAN